MLCLSGFELYPRWVPLKTADGGVSKCRLFSQATGFRIPQAIFPDYTEIISVLQLLK